MSHSSRFEWPLLGDCARALMALRYVFLDDVKFIDIDASKSLQALSTKELEKILKRTAQFRDELENRKKYARRGPLEKRFYSKMEELRKLGAFRRSPALKRALTSLLDPSESRIPKSWNELASRLTDPKFINSLKKTERRNVSIVIDPGTKKEQSALGYDVADFGSYTTFCHVLRKSVQWYTIPNRGANWEGLLLSHIPSEVKRDIQEEVRGSRSKTKDSLETTEDFQRVLNLSRDESKKIRVVSTDGTTTDGTLSYADEKVIQIEINGPAIDIKTESIESAVVRDDGQRKLTGLGDFEDHIENDKTKVVEIQTADETYRGYLSFVDVENELICLECQQSHFFRRAFISHASRVMETKNIRAKTKSGGEDLESYREQ